MAKAVVTFSNSVGCILEMTIYGNSGTFPLNCIDPLGSPSPTNNAFSSPLIGDDCRSRSGGFDYHAFAQNAGDKVWDATLKYDIDNNPDNVSGSNPDCGSIATGYSWTNPCNEIEPTYISRLKDAWTRDHEYNPGFDRDNDFYVQ